MSLNPSTDSNINPVTGSSGNIEPAVSGPQVISLDWIAQQLLQQNRDFREFQHDFREFQQSNQQQLQQTQQQFQQHQQQFQQLLQQCQHDRQALRDEGKKSEERLVAQIAETAERGEEKIKAIQQQVDETIAAVESVTQIFNDTTNELKGRCSKLESQVRFLNACCPFFSPSPSSASSSKLAPEPTVAIRQLFLAGEGPIINHVAAISSHVTGANSVPTSVISSLDVVVDEKGCDTFSVPIVLSSISSAIPPRADVEAVCASLSSLAPAGMRPQTSVANSRSSGLPFVSPRKRDPVPPTRVLRSQAQARVARAAAQPVVLSKGWPPPPPRSRTTRPQDSGVDSREV